MVQDLYPSTITSEESVSSTAVTLSGFIRPSTITSEENVSSIKNITPLLLYPSTIASEESVSASTLTLSGGIKPSTIISEESVNSVSLTSSGYIKPSKIPVTVTFGTPTVYNSTRRTVQSGAWSNTSTWENGIVAGNAEHVIISEGDTLTVDIDASSWSVGTPGIIVEDDATLTVDPTIRTYLKLCGSVVTPYEIVEDEINPGADDKIYLGTGQVVYGTEEDPILSLNDGNPATAIIEFIAQPYLRTRQDTWYVFYYGGWGNPNLNEDIWSYFEEINDTSFLDLIVTTKGETRGLYDKIAQAQSSTDDYIILQNGLTVRAGDEIVIENSNFGYAGPADGGHAGGPFIQPPYTPVKTVLSYDPELKKVTFTSAIGIDLSVDDSVGIMTQSIKFFTTDGYMMCYSAPPTHTYTTYADFHGVHFDGFSLGGWTQFNDYVVMNFQYCIGDICELVNYSNTSVSGFVKDCVIFFTTYGIYYINRTSIERVYFFGVGVGIVLARWCAIIDCKIINGWNLVNSAMNSAIKNSEVSSSLRFGYNDLAIIKDIKIRRSGANIEGISSGNMLFYHDFTIVDGVDLTDNFEDGVHDVCFAWNCQNSVFINVDLSFFYDEEVPYDFLNSTLTKNYFIDCSYDYPIDHLLAQDYNNVSALNGYYECINFNSPGNYAILHCLNTSEADSTFVPDGMDFSYKVNFVKEYLGFTPQESFHQIPIHLEMNEKITVNAWIYKDTDWTVEPKLQLIDSFADPLDDARYHNINHIPLAEVQPLDENEEWINVSLEYITPKTLDGCIRVVAEGAPSNSAFWAAFDEIQVEDMTGKMPDDHIFDKSTFDTDKRRVAAEIITPYNSEGTVTAELKMPWNVSVYTVEVELKMPYDELVEVGTELVTPWSASFVTTELKMPYDSVGTVTAELRARWHSTSPVETSLRALWTTYPATVYDEEAAAVLEGGAKGFLEVVTPWGKYIYPKIRDGRIKLQPTTDTAVFETLDTTDYVPEDSRCAFFYLNGVKLFEGRVKTVSLVEGNYYEIQVYEFAEVFKPEPPKGGLYLVRDRWDHVLIPDLLSSDPPGETNNNTVGLLWIANSCLFGFRELLKGDNTHDNNIYRWDYNGLPYIVTEVWQDDVLLDPKSSVEELRSASGWFHDTSGDVSATKTIYVRCTSDEHPYEHAICVPNIWDSDVPIRLGNVRLPDSLVDHTIAWFETGYGQSPNEAITTILNALGLEKEYSLRNGILYMDIAERIGAGTYEEPAAVYVEASNIRRFNEFVMADARSQANGIVVLGYGQGAGQICSMKHTNYGRGGRFTIVTEPSLYEIDMADSFAEQYLAQSVMPERTIRATVDLVHGGAVQQRRKGDSVHFSVPSLHIEQSLRLQEAEIDIGAAEIELTCGDYLTTLEDKLAAMGDLIDKYIQHLQTEIERFSWSWQDNLVSNMPKTEKFNITEDAMKMQKMQLTCATSLYRDEEREPGNSGGRSGGGGRGGPGGGGAEGGGEQKQGGAFPPHVHVVKTSTNPSDDCVRVSAPDHSHTVFGETDKATADILPAFSADEISGTSGQVLTDATYRQTVEWDCCTGVGCSRTFVSNVESSFTPVYGTVGITGGGGRFIHDDLELGDDGHVHGIDFDITGELSSGITASACDHRHFIVGMTGTPLDPRKIPPFYVALMQQSVIGENEYTPEQLEEIKKMEKISEIMGQKIKPDAVQNEKTWVELYNSLFDEDVLEDPDYWMTIYNRLGQLSSSSMSGINIDTIRNKSSTLIAKYDGDGKFVPFTDVNDYRKTQQEFKKAHPSGVLGSYGPGSPWDMEAFLASAGTQDTQNIAQIKSDAITYNNGDDAGLVEYYAEYCKRVGLFVPWIMIPTLEGEPKSVIRPPTPQGSPLSDPLILVWISIGYRGPPHKDNTDEEGGTDRTKEGDRDVNESKYGQWVGGTTRAVTDMSDESEHTDFKIKVGGDTTWRTVSCDWTNCATSGSIATEIQEQIRALAKDHPDLFYDTVNVIYELDRYKITAYKDVQITSADENDCTALLKLGSAYATSADSDRTLTSGSSPETDMSDNTHTSFKIKANGDTEYHTVTCSWAGCSNGSLVAQEMQEKIAMLDEDYGEYEYSDTSVSYTNGKYVITTNSTLSVIDADTNSCADDLKLTSATGATEDGYKSWTGATTGAKTNMSGNTTDIKFEISINDDDEWHVVTCNWTGCDTGYKIAVELQKEINALATTYTGHGYEDVTVAFKNDGYVFTSGLEGDGSRVEIQRADDHDCCDELMIDEDNSTPYEGGTRGGATAGYWTGGGTVESPARTNMVGDPDTKFRIMANGDTLWNVVTCNWTGCDTGEKIAEEMQKEIQKIMNNSSTDGSNAEETRTQNSDSEEDSFRYEYITVKYVDGHYVFTSDVKGPTSRVEISREEENDCCDDLKLDESNGGIPTYGTGASDFVGTPISGSPFVILIGDTIGPVLIDDIVSKAGEYEVQIACAPFDTSAKDAKLHFSMQIDGIIFVETIIEEPV